jgi:hypothetical protein
MFRLPQVGEIDGLGKNKHIMPAKIGIRLLARDQEKIAVGKTLAAFEIDLLLVLAAPTRIVRVPIAVKIGKNCDVDAERAEHRKPGRLQVDVPASVSCSLKWKWKWPGL